MHAKAWQTHLVSQICIVLSIDPHVNQNRRGAVIKRNASNVIMIVTFVVEAALGGKGPFSLAEHTKLQIGEKLYRTVQGIVSAVKYTVDPTS